MPDHAKSSDATEPPGGSSAGSREQRLSSQIAARYQCQISDDLADWFDSQIWKQIGQSEYCDPVDPRTLLEPAPEVIWPGLMPCDFLPLIGSRAGDWLGVKFDRDNHASEIIQWYHGGGDWIPWGKTISEAIVFGAVCNRLPGPRRRHAVPAEDFCESTATTTSRDPLFAWALEHVAASANELQNPNVPSIELANTLLHHGIAEVAVRCDLVQEALAENLSCVLDHPTVAALGVEWATAVEWMFDVGRLPQEVLRHLESERGYTRGSEQDWQVARTHAQAVTQASPDVAWAWDILGYCHEKSDQSDQAAKAYQQGITKSVFSDQSVKLRTHWASATAAKFSASRLIALGKEIPSSIAPNYLAAMTLPNLENRRIAATDYWLAVADTTNHASERIDALVAAGWDLGAEPITTFADILGRIATADPSQTARSTLASTHRECLRQRYGI